MPKSTMIAVTDIVSTRGGRPTSAAFTELLTFCNTELTAARASGEALSITLESGERPATIKRAFRATAETLGIGVKFITSPGGTRPYTTKKGKVKAEEFIFAVKIVPLAETDTVTSDEDEDEDETEE